MADRLWSLAVRSDWADKCAVCGANKCEAHHLVPRQHEATRYDLQNGISLCTQHHKFDKDLAPHQNAAGWMQWLGQYHPELLAWYVANPRPTFEGTKNAAYYIETILYLKQYVEAADFEAIVGVRFSQYLEDK